jgi:aspartate/methionine/tyrosine aminotransferase
VFSTRLPSNLTANRLTEAVRACRAGGRPFVDLTLSNPTRAGLEYPSDLLRALADPRALQYDPRAAGAIDAREAVSADYARQGLTVPSSRIVLTASTSDAYSLLFKLLADAGDDVLVPRPSYPLFEHLTRLDLVATHAYDLDLHGSWAIDFASVERALTPRTRAVLIVNPNNPTGSFVSSGELDRLAALCAPRGIAIIADEVFADYELDPGSAAGVARATKRDDVLSFALGGLSKSVGLPQVKLGWMAVGGPDRLAAQAIERLDVICDSYLSVSTPVQVAAADLLTRGAAVRSQIAARVSANHRTLHAAVGATSPCRALRSAGGWYAVLQVPSLEPEDDLVVRLLSENAVLVHPGFFYDFPRESFLVVSLLPPQAAFADGIARVLRHFDCTRSTRS